MSNTSENRRKEERKMAVLTAKCGRAFAVSPEQSKKFLEQKTNSKTQNKKEEIVEQESDVYNYNENCDLNDNYIIELSKYYECFLVSSDKYMASASANINVLSA